MSAAENQATETERWAPRVRLLPKSRLEAFSDGVMAIVITLLVLELEVPEESTELLAALAEEWVSYLGYIVSFVFVGGLWLSHVDLTRFIKRSDSVFMRLNLGDAALRLLSAVHDQPHGDAPHRRRRARGRRHLRSRPALRIADDECSGRVRPKHPDLAADEVDAKEVHAFVRRRWVGVVV